MKKTLLLIILLSFGNINAQLCFNPPIYVPTFTNSAAEPCSGDFNNDGKLDIATANTSNGGSIILGTGTGSFLAPTQFTTFGYNPITLATADFNGDLNADLALATNSLVEIYLGNGTGTFSIPTNTIFLSSFTSSSNYFRIISNDFNLDGNPDLAVSDGAVHFVYVFLGLGTGNFGTPSSYSVGTYPSDLVSKDFNNDGFPDIVTNNLTSGNISVLLNNGTGNFSPSTNFLSIPNSVRMTSADFNNDGNQDIATVDNAGTGNYHLLFGNGVGGFGSVTSFSLNGTPQAFDIVNSDFNSDGNKDLAIACFLSYSVAIVLGSGTGTFSPSFNYSVTYPAVALISEDYNGDSKMDIIASALTLTTSVIYFQNCSTTSIMDFNNQQSVSIFPNPTSNILYVSPMGNAFENSQIEITNTLGQTVLKVRYKNEINVSQLSNGYYMLKISNPDNQQFNSRFIKN